MSRPFLAISTRSDEAVAASELEELHRFTGLSSDALVRARVEQVPFPSIDLDEWSGLIICGSPFDASAPEAEKSAVQRGIEAELGRLYDRVLARDFPMLGICYGLGTLARHLDGVVDSTHTEPISAPLLRVTEAGRVDPLLAGLPDQFRGYVGHHEAVTALPDGVGEIVVRGEVAPFQMVRFTPHVHGTQFHPELDLDGILLRIREYADRGYFADGARGSVEDEVRSADVSPVHTLLARFAALNAR